jgi:hypothetical protein
MDEVEELSRASLLIAIGFCVAFLAVVAASAFFAQPSGRDNRTSPGAPACVPPCP